MKRLPGSKRSSRPEENGEGRYEEEEEEGEIKNEGERGERGKQEPDMRSMSVIWSSR